MTANVETRLRQHNAGQVQSTKGRRPFCIAYTELHASRGEARAREKYLKTAAGRRWLKTKIPRAHSSTG